MSSSDSYNDEKSPDSDPAPSGEAHTPRGGFMARPGLKAPPRHAVVVRVGDAPESEHIPLARSSVPPPPPASVAPGPVSASEQITLRTIPAGARREAREASNAARAVDTIARTSSRNDASLGVIASESSPPPSDAPLIASLNGPESSAPRSRRAGSRWTIVAAAAAGLILGLASVVMKVHTLRSAAQPVELTPAAPVAAPTFEAADPTMTRARPLASSSAAPMLSTSIEQRAPVPPATGNRAALTGAKHSIF